MHLYAKRENKHFLIQNETVMNMCDRLVKFFHFFFLVVIKNERTVRVVFIFFEFSNLCNSTNEDIKYFEISENKRIYLRSHYHCLYK